MYLLSRILFGLCRLGSEKGYLPSSDPKKGGRVWFPLFGATVWGVVLWLFEYHRNTLQPSLQSSMTYLYDDSSVWHSLTDFLLYNKMPDFWCAIYYDHIAWSFTTAVASIRVECIALPSAT